MRFEWELWSDDDNRGSGVVVDGGGNALDPQPVCGRLENFRMEIKPAAIAASIAAEEAELVKLFAREVDNCGDKRSRRAVRKSSDSEGEEMTSPISPAPSAPEPPRIVTRLGAQNGALDVSSFGDLQSPRISASTPQRSTEGSYSASSSAQANSPVFGYNRSGVANPSSTSHKGRLMPVGDTCPRPPPSPIRLSDSEKSSSDAQSTELGSESTESDSSESELEDEDNAKEESEILPYVIPDFCFHSNVFRHSYIPQIGEEVIYLRKGHQAWGKKCMLLEFPPPYMLRHSLPCFVRAIVSNMQFIVSHFIITLDFDDFKAKVAYPVPECFPFLVSATHFKASMSYMTTLSVGDIVCVDLEEKGVLKEFRARVAGFSNNWTENPFDSVIVTFCDDNTKGRLQPWELKFQVGELNKDLMKMMQICEFLANTVRDFAQKREYNEFRECRSEKVLRVLVSEGKMPMDLTLLRERLENCYYVALEGIIHDIEMLKVNSGTLGQDQRSASRLTSDLKIAAKRFASDVDLEMRT
jgi:hypothetical protein